MFGIMILLGSGVLLVNLRKSAKIFWQADKAEPDSGWSVLAFAAGEALPSTLICIPFMLVAECLALYIKFTPLSRFIIFTEFSVEVALIGIVPIVFLLINAIKLTYQAIKHKKLNPLVVLSIARIASATLFLSALLLFILVSYGDFLSDGNPYYKYQTAFSAVAVLMAGVTTLLTLITAQQSARQSKKWAAVTN